MKFLMFKVAPLHEAYIIGQVVHEDETSYVLDLPMQLELIPDQGTVRAIVNRWIPFTNDDYVTVNKASIVVTADPSDAFIHYYEMMRRRHVQDDLASVINNLIRRETDYQMASKVNAPYSTIKQ